MSLAVSSEILDQQIRESVNRVKGRFECWCGDRVDPVAVVCFGPSLVDTWEELRGYRFIISCSGSHRFLLDRGIVPTWHCEADPRKHKATLIGPPNQSTEYLICSTCHKAVFDLLEGYNVKLWHQLGAKPEWDRGIGVGGGSDIGLRGIVIARLLGFLEIHVFGMDGSGGHAAEHPNKEAFDTLDYCGTEYLVKPSLIKAVFEVKPTLDLVAPAKVTFHGDGLVQRMFKNGPVG